MAKNNAILIIDDDKTLVEVMQLVLKEDGYTVHTVTGWQNITTWLHSHTPDLILIDYLMPGENGAHITRRLRRHPVTAKTPIIMLAATKAYEKDGLAAGVTTFLTKPFNLETLTGTVRRYIQLES